MTYRQVRIRKDPNCAVCGEHPTVTELIDYDAFCGTISEEAAEAARDSTISVVELKDMLDARAAGEDRLRPHRRPRAGRVRDRQHRRGGPHPEGAVPRRLGARAAARATGRSCCTARSAADRPRRSRSSRGPASPTRSTSAAASSPGSARSSRTSRRTDVGQPGNVLVVIGFSSGLLPWSAGRGSGRLEPSWPVH